MKERPILFQGAMVRALLAGTKTQTRRAVKPQPWASCCIEEGMEGEPPFVYSALGGDGPGHDVHETRSPCRCPYGAPGDRLWVRETFYAFGRWETRFSTKKGRDEWHFVDMTQELNLAYRHAADSDEVPHMLGRKLAGAAPTWWKRPAIHMPRAASRITLEIASVRAERLQEISEADAMAEGIGWNDYEDENGERMDPRDAYRCLWEQINGAGSWESNPWVWVVEFRRVTP
ncbi:MAG: hypothetical protein K0S48_19 [Ramlibacter sp.]|jgi:hypothetical protein|nr:hypothetical protein [Ramlibacter sp.]